MQSKVKHSFSAPPPKEFLLELAEEKNKNPLPGVPEKYGIRLPAERHCLTAVNFDIAPEGSIENGTDGLMKEEEDETAVEEAPESSRRMEVDEEYDF